MKMVNEYNKNTDEEESVSSLFLHNICEKIIKVIYVIYIGIEDIKEYSLILEFV